jgi:chaperonin GroES
VTDLSERTAVDGNGARRLDQKPGSTARPTTDSSLRRLFMKLQPLADRLIVEVLEEEESTESGIVLPDTAKEKPQRGRVLAVGPGARDKDGKQIQMDVVEGDEVIFSKYGGTEIKVGSDEVLILRESDVLAKVTPRASKSERSLAGATA